MNQEATLNREVVITEWLRYGFEDLMIAFFPLDKWIYYQPFFLAQALEKTAKAYLLGSRSSEYENLSFTESKITVDDMARNYGHKIDEIIKFLQAHIPVIKSILDKNYDGYMGSEIVKVLSSGYLESRYPVPKSICENYPINGRRDAWWDPLASSGLQKFVFDFIGVVLKKIKEDCDVELKRENLFYCYQNRISQNDWDRFCNLFFKDSTYGV